LQHAATTGLAGAWGGLPLLSRLQPVSAADAQLRPDDVVADTGLAPLVHLIEATPRPLLLEAIAEQIAHGRAYRDILAALMLAGVTNVAPRPSVGHKFHTVLVVHSAHLASMSGPANERWLPLFWALDYFKAAAERDVQENGDWRMQPLPDDRLPSASAALAALRTALDNWDEEAADAAAAQLARSGSVGEAYELLFRYGARDFRSIGHKAIYVANSFRTLQAIGVRHAEPILRSLAFALLNHEGDNPRDRDAEADRPYRENLPLAAEFRDDWRDGRRDPGAVSELLATLRTDAPSASARAVVAQINAGVGPAAIWDALHLGAAELLLRQRGIVALHAVTTANALYFAYQAAADDQTRRLLTLQCAAFLPMFREAMLGRGEVRDAHVLELPSDDVPTASDDAREAIFAALRSDEQGTPRRVLGYLAAGHDPSDLLDDARTLVFLKGNDAHDYKFSSAVLEDFWHVDAAYRARYLAATAVQLCGADTPDNPLVARTRAALGA
jgi:hypothetical protein